MSNNNPHHVDNGGPAGGIRQGDAQANAIIDAIDRLTAAVKALVPGPCDKGMYTGSDGGTVRCVLPLGHHGRCDCARR